MIKVALAALTGCILALGMAASPANATLYGWCGSGVTSTCIDNGTNSPTSLNPPNPFGFTSSPPNETGNLYLAVLVPDNEASVFSYAISGAALATASLFSFTPWTSGQLDAYFGISASPPNPIGAYLPSTQVLDPAASGFYVYVASLGPQTLAGPGGPPNQLFDITDLPPASYIIGFMDTGGGDATANSGAIFITTGAVVPEPTTMLILGAGVLGIGLSRRFRRNR
jgi:hypothetical protein